MGYGVVVGVLVALVVLALLVYVLLIAPPGNTVTPGGSTNPSTGGSVPISTPSGSSAGTLPSATPLETASPSAS